MKLFIKFLLIIMTTASVNATTNQYGKVLQVKKISIADVALQDVPALLDSMGIAFENVDVANWPDANAQTPDAKFRIAHTGNAFVVNFLCTENSVAATANDMGWNVWEDACMEFFSQPVADDGIYYNVECNCTGTVLLNGGKPGTERTHASRNHYEHRALVIARSRTVCRTRRHLHLASGARDSRRVLFPSPNHRPERYDHTRQFL